MRYTKLLKTAAVVSVAALSLAAKPAKAEMINGAGATFPYPIYKVWFNTFHQENNGITINYQAVGSGAGIAQYKAGTVDFGATDAPLSNADLASMSQPTLHIPTVAGAVVLAYNVPGVGPGLRLSGEEIADIYLGKITTWNDARIAKQNPGLNLPNTTITVVHRADSSGTSFIFTNYLASVSGAWKSGPGAGKSVAWPKGIGGNGNPGIAGLIKNSPGAIGYVELAYAIQNKMTYGPVRNKSGNYVNASLATTTAAAQTGAKAMERDVRTLIVNAPGVNSYPICGFTYLLVSKTPKNVAKGRELVSFLKWAIEDQAQKLAAEALYAPLPREVVSINERAIAQIHVK